MEIEIDERYLQDVDRDVTESELAMHDSYEAGLWAALDGIVYDMTEYEHPGGEKKMEKVAGTDATEAYLKVFPNKHPVPIEDVELEDGIVRIGPLVEDPPPTDAPVTLSPVSPSPTPVPTTAAPSTTTASPITGSPVSSAPVTMKPITAAPVEPEPLMTEAPAPAPAPSCSQGKGLLIPAAVVAAVAFSQALEW